MYENHWRLRQRPFENWSADPFYYPSECHQTSLLKLRYALEAKRAAMVVAGDSGMGKSMLVELLLKQLPESLAPKARIVFPQLAGDQLLGYLADKVTGRPGDPNEPIRLTLARLEAFLTQNTRQDRHAVIVVDEAHLLSAGDGLETLRMLLNFDGGDPTAESAWSLILVGQATVMGLIERNRSLDERIAVKCLLHRFQADQTAAYLQHRIAAAGGEADQIFSPDAIEALHVRGAGIPRRINRLADLALMVGFAEDLSRVEAEQIDGVHQELVSPAA